MDNKEFQATLEKISYITDTKEKVVEAVPLLMQAYDEDLEIYARCHTLNSNPDLGRQTYIGAKEHRFLMCYTSSEHANNEKRLDLIKPGESVEIVQMRVRDIISNMMNKSVIDGLIINSDDNKNNILILKMMVALLL